MDFLTLAQERYSCRYFDTEKPVEKEKIAKIAINNFVNLFFIAILPALKYIYFNSIFF